MRDGEKFHEQVGVYAYFAAKPQTLVYTPRIESVCLFPIPL
jgi:hypothetical protein